MITLSPEQIATLKANPAKIKDLIKLGIITSEQAVSLGLIAKPDRNRVSFSTTQSGSVAVKMAFRRFPITFFADEAETLIRPEVQQALRDFVEANRQNLAYMREDGKISWKGKVMSLDEKRALTEKNTIKI